MYNWRKAKKKNNIDVYQKLGDENRQSELMAESDEKTNYFPKAIEIEDLDIAFFDLIREGELKLDIDGQVVPVIIMNSERWAEFTQTWKYTNDDKNMVPPFITILRESVTEGTYIDVKYSIPNRMHFPYMKVQTFKDGKLGYDIYKIPQPVAVDIMYNVSFFSNYIQDTNMFYKKYLTAFSGRQVYIRPNGHFMPVVKEDDGQEDLVQDIDDQRLFVKIFNLKLTGYIQNDEEFEKVEAINRIFMSTEVSGDKQGTKKQAGS
jgi:hypothetical protein